MNTDPMPPAAPAAKPKKAKKPNPEADALRVELADAGKREAELRRALEAKAADLERAQLGQQADAAKERAAREAIRKLQGVLDKWKGDWPPDGLVFFSRDGGELTFGIMRAIKDAPRA